MTNQVIPAEAVEAAARAAAKDEDASNWDDEHEYYRNGWRNRMQVGLEAAAPHMLAAAWDEGFRLGQTTLPTAAKSTPNPYRSRT